MTQLQTLIGEQAMFVLEAILYFGVTRSDKFISQMFRSSEIAEICNALESFDLSNHPNGLKVILKESTDGRFTITGENM